MNAVDCLRKIVEEADANPFNPIGHVIEHVVPQVREALAASEPVEAVEAGCACDGKMTDGRHWLSCPLSHPAPEQPGKGEAWKTKRASEIEDAIATGKMTAAQVFTQMRQLIQAPQPSDPAEGDAPSWSDWMASLQNNLLDALINDPDNMKAHVTTAFDKVAALAAAPQPSDPADGLPWGWKIVVKGEHVRVTKPDGSVSEWQKRPETNGSGMYDLCIALSTPPTAAVSGEAAAVESVLKDRGYPCPLTAEWMAKHLDHYQQMIDVYSRLKSSAMSVDDATIRRFVDALGFPYTFAKLPPPSVIRAALTAALDPQVKR